MHAGRHVLVEERDVLDVLRVRQAIARGEYDVDARLDAVAEALLAELRRRCDSSRKRA